MRKIERGALGPALHERKRLYFSGVMGIEPCSFSYSATRLFRHCSIALFAERSSDLAIYRNFWKSHRSILNVKRKILRSIFLLLYYTVVSDFIIVKFTVQNESGEKVTHTFCKGKVAVSGGGGLSAGNSLKQKKASVGGIRDTAKARRSKETCKSSIMRIWWSLFGMGARGGRDMWLNIAKRGERR